MTKPDEKPAKSLDALLSEISDSLRRVRDNELTLPTRVFKREGDNFSVETFEKDHKVAKAA